MLAEAIRVKNPVTTRRPGEEPGGIFFRSRPKINPVTTRRPGGEPGGIFFRTAAGRGRDWIFFRRVRRRGVVTGFFLAAGGRDWIFSRSGQISRQRAGFFAAKKNLVPSMRKILSRPEPWFGAPEPVT